MNKVVLLNVAALGLRDLGVNTPKLSALMKDGVCSALVPTQPSLTCPSHATMVTGLDPSVHGVIANGWYDRAHAKVFNWGRSDNLVQGAKIWDELARRSPGSKTVNLFWRYCTHADCAMTMTERPTYFSDGRKGADVYSSDPAFKQLCLETLGPFPFFHFWGPKAGVQSSDWILKAGRIALEQYQPDLFLCYAPGLDYDVQRFGVDAPETLDTLRKADAMIVDFINDVAKMGYSVMLVSDYVFANVTQPIFLNRHLRERGWLAVDDAVNGEWLEPGASRAFAVADNQVAHVYVNDISIKNDVRAQLETIDGVDAVYDMTEGGLPVLNHERSGELVVFAKRHAWFAYPYWLSPEKAPDFSRGVDIFNKPGFDPCELNLRPGFGGKLHAARRFIQLKTGIRAPFDVIAADSQLIRGSRLVKPESDLDYPVLWTSWARPNSNVAMRDIKEVVLNHLSPGHA